jgi:hypothetical protein
MRRIVLIIGCVTGIIFGGMFYQYQQQQKQVTQLHAYQNVIYEKAEQIFVQAQDWSKPIQIDLKDNRLDGDYQIMASFVLSHMVQSAEARNSYLRKKQDYADTEAMLVQVRAMVELYQEHLEQHEAMALEQIENLEINHNLRRHLAESLLESRHNDQGHALFELEKKNLGKAYVLFAILKNNKWELKNNTFMFYEDAALKEFNTVYQEMVQLNTQMHEISQQHQRALESKL